MNTEWFCDDCNKHFCNMMCYEFNTPIEGFIRLCKSCVEFRRKKEGEG